MGRLKAARIATFYGLAGLCLGGPSALQLLAAEPEFDIQTWQSDEGLPRPGIVAIAQGSDGYLWVGTWDNRARFDGVRFTEYSPEHTPELQGFGISKIVSDPYGRVWHATAGGGLSCWFAGRWNRCLPDVGPGHSVVEVFGEADGSALVMRADGHILRWTHGRCEDWPSAGKWGEPSVKDVCRDKTGSLWFITDAGKLVKASSPNDQTEVEPGGELVGREWRSVQADAEGNIWVGTERELAVRRGDKFESTMPPTLQAPFAVEHIIPATGGRLWVAANHRLWLWQNGTWVTNVCAWPPLGVPAKARLTDRTGRLWLGTSGHGLLCANTDGQLAVLTAKEGLLGDTVSALCEDHEGNIWVGLDRAGLARLRPRRFGVLGPKEGLAVPVVWTICEDPSGAIWLGTEGGGLNRWYQGRLTRFDVGWQNTPGEVRSLLVDAAGSLWVGTSYKGLFRLDSEQLTVPLDMKRINYQVFAMHEDQRGRLWIGSMKGLYRWDRQTDEVKSFGQADGLTNTNVRAIVRDAVGRMWVGTYGGGVARLEGERFVHCGPPGAVGQENVSGLYPDADGALWIATVGGGLCCLRTNEFTSYNTKQGLPDDRIAYVIEDGMENLWLGSPGGIFRVSKRALASLDRGETDRLACLAFDKADGLPTRVCTGGSQPACWRAHDGRLWLGTDGGAVFVKPDEININALPPAVLIEELVADDETVAHISDLNQSSSSGLGSPAETQRSSGSARSAKPLEIGPGRQLLEFRYTATSLSAPEKVRFRCRLEGLDKDWGPPSTRRAAAYYHVPAGKYRFHVIACNNDGVWNEAGAILEVTLLPHFWQTWWFRLMVGAAALLCLVAAYEIRLARTRSLARLRLRIGRDLHDEVGSNLGSIALVAQIMQTEAGGVCAADAAEIRRIAIATINSLRDIVWFLDPSHDRMSDLVSRMKETANTMLRGVRFEFHESGETNASQLSLAFRRNALPIFKEALNNIVKHAKATRVEITLNCDPRVFQLRIADNGVGFDPRRVQEGNGMKNLVRRAKEMGGKLQVESQPGRGTTVTLEASIPWMREWLLRG